ncbi:MAG: hypothetical protein HZB26_26365 [Candidatus Hydrogenedentes bacterium]|nr:hypothetical protein [Candidatus Hydrogenedentota bacterium]
MPCSDVTEVIHVALDAEERLTSYHFAKRTCGQAIGAASLLMDQLGGRTVDELLAYDAEHFLADYTIEDEIEEFLSLKHLFAIQSALEVLTGKEPGGPEDPCAAAEISYEDGELTIDAEINLDLVTEKIKSCGNCKGCGKTKEKIIFV